MKRRRSRSIGFIVLAIIILAGVFAYISYRMELHAVSADTSTQIFTITSGERVPAIADALESSKLIRSRNSFITYMNLHGLRAKVKAGTFSLSPSDSSPKIAAILTGTGGNADSITVPEGYRVSQIEALVAKHGISTSSFEAALNEQHTQAVLTTGGKPTTVGLEGYLFPDTYEITPATSASQLVNMMIDDFNKRVNTAAYTQAFAAEGLTLHQGLTLASIVEREVSNPNDRPIVAQVFLKRYHEGISLGSDVTTQYASDLAGVPFDLSLDSPYNTRLNVGLPPGPICNPGLDALNAVAHPAATSYLFFYAGTDGKTYFANTLAEHNANIAAHSSK